MINSRGGGVLVTQAADDFHPQRKMEETSLFAAPLRLPPRPAAPSRQRRRDALPCLVPDIDLLCDETLSEDGDSDGEEIGEAIWTQLKDPNRLSFWQDRKGDADASIRYGPSTGSPDGRHAAVRSPPVKKRRVPDASETSGEECIRSAPSSSPAARVESHCPSSPLSNSRDVQDRGYEDSGQGSASRAANIRPRDRLTQLSHSPSTNSEVKNETSQVDQSTSSWDVRGGLLDARPSSEDFHTVPEIGDSYVWNNFESHSLSNSHNANNVYSWEKDDDLSGETQSNNFNDESSERSSEISGSCDEESSSSSDRDDVIELLPDSDADEYVVYSSQSSEDDDQPEVEGPRRRLASCDATDHVVPNAVMEE